MFGGTPRVRSRVVCEGLSRDGLAFACDMRLIEELDIIIADAVTRQARFVYQAHIAHLQPAPSVLREARVNASRIRAHRGVPAPVARRQEFMAARLQQACAVTEEFVATDPAHGAWLGDHLRRVLTEQNGDLGVDGAALAPAMDAYEDELATGLHQSRLVGLPFDSVVSQAIDETTLSRIAAWAPGASLASLLALAVDPDDGAPSPRGLAAPASPQAPRYLFVSYAHADTPRVEAIIRTAARAGISLWWDAHIPGGSEWDEHLETRIRESAGVVLFLSSSAVASKYVRREVKFADLVGKRIFSVELEPRVELTHGLAMLLTQYQRLSADRPDLLDHLRSGASPA
jgi:hypothetical protein